MRRLLVILATVGAAFAGLAATATAALPPIHHVYTIVLENESASTTFGPNSPAPYLSQTLRSQGAYLPQYHGVGHNSLDNYIALVSGQAPNTQTQEDCQVFSNFPGNPSGQYGQVSGTGCVYQATVPTIASQLQGAGRTWRDYNDGMGADPKREAAVCGHPTVDTPDNTQTATATDQYATRHNPFMYFHAIIDNTTLCDTHVVNLDALPQDLATPKTPNYVFITPNLCDDGHDATCAGGGLGGLPRADQFLKTWVPKITGSTAFRRDGGLLLILFDEAATSDTTACCGEIPGPGAPDPGSAAGLNAPGGGVTGAVLLSPYIKAGTVTQQPYNHYTTLRSIEDLFGLSHIGYAQLPGERSLGSDVFACVPAKAPVAHRGKLPAGSEFTRLKLHKRRRRAPQLSLYSVGAASLRVTLTRGRGRHRTRRVIRRTLTPCRGLTLTLQRGKGWRVSVSATPLSGGSQSATLHY